MYSSSETKEYTEIKIYEDASHQMKIQAVCDSCGANMGHQYCDFSSCDKWLCYLCAKYCRYCGREFCHDHLCPPIHGCDGCVDPFPYQRTTDDELRSQIAEGVQVPEGGGEVGTHSPTFQVLRGNSSDSSDAWQTYIRGNVVSEYSARLIQSFLTIMSGTGKLEHDEERGQWQTYIKPWSLRTAGHVLRMNQTTG